MKEINLTMRRMLIRSQSKMKDKGLFFTRRVIVELKYFTAIKKYFSFVFQSTCLTFNKSIPPSEQIIHTIGRKS